MSFRVLDDRCIGCGACDFSCPTGALRKTDSYLGLFVVDPFTCDDCARCVPTCPEGAIVPDPAWAVCRGRGCPLAAARLAGTGCTVWQERCPECGTTLWERDGAAGCPRCTLGLKVRCPRTRRLGEPAPPGAEGPAVPPLPRTG